MYHTDDHLLIETSPANNQESNKQGETCHVRSVWCCLFRLLFANEDKFHLLVSGSALQRDDRIARCCKWKMLTSTEGRRQHVS